LDRESDALLIGSECFGICGDADGDGDPSRTSAALAALGGVDVPNLGRTESFAMALDFNYSVADYWPSFQPDLNPPFDLIVGKPGGQPDGAKANANVAGGEVALLPCVECFGVYVYDARPASGTVPMSRRFLKPYLTSTGAVWPIDGFNLNPTPERPDLEWKILRINEIFKSYNPFYVEDGPVEILTHTFAGSEEDATIGDEYVPSIRDYGLATFPCNKFDQCDICLGDGSSCTDCAGIPNGPNTYNAMDVCSSSTATQQQSVAITVESRPATTEIIATPQAPTAQRETSGSSFDVSEVTRDFVDQVNLPFSTASIAIVVVFGILCLLALVAVVFLSRRKSSVSNV